MFGIVYNNIGICFHFIDNNNDINNKSYFKQTLLKRYQITENFNVLGDYLTKNNLSLTDDFLNKEDDVIYTYNGANKIFIYTNDFICNIITNIEYNVYKRKIFKEYNKYYNKIDNLIKYEVFRSNKEFLKFVEFNYGNIFEIMQYSGLNNIVLMDPIENYINLIKDNDMTHEFIYAKVNLNKYNQSIFDKILINKNDELQVEKYKKLIIDDPKVMIAFYAEYKPFEETYEDISETLTKLINDNPEIKKIFWGEKPNLNNILCNETYSPYEKHILQQLIKTKN